MNVRNFASTDLPLVDVFVWSKYVTRKSGFIDLFTFLCVGALLVLSAYAAPATESRSELVGQKANENDDLDDEDEAIEKRRFRGVKRSFADVEDSEEKLEKRGGGSGHQKERDVERVLKDTDRVKDALKELMAAMRELDRRVQHREHKPEAAAPAGPAAPASASASASSSASAGAAGSAEKPTDEQAVPVPMTVPAPGAEGAAGAGADEGAAGAERRRSASVVDKVAMMAKRNEKRRSSQINVPLRWG